MTRPLLEIQHVFKAFPGVQALDDVSLDVSAGTIHALVGENGAGKSTLMKILAGIYRRDRGDILFDGYSLVATSAREARMAGISIIHQELNLPLNLGIHQSIFLGRIPTRGFGIVDWKALDRQTADLLRLVQLDAKPRTTVGSLNVASRQLVEIAKALSFESKLLIMDEPTSALNRQETATLFRIIRNLKKNGVTVIYISHRLEEIFEIADEITVMRDGRVVGTKRAAETSHEEIVQMMTGKSLVDFFAKGRGTASAGSGEVILRVRNLSQKRLVNNVSFDLHKGEVLGIAGLLGSGRTELVKAIFGADKRTTGDVFLEGTRVDASDPSVSVESGIALLPEDRKNEGAHLDMTIRENVSLSAIERVSRNGFVLRKRQTELAKEMAKKLRLKATGPEQLVRDLSGGNQQKVVISKWLAARPKVLLLDDPTRGIDVGAKSEIYGIIRELANQGLGVIFISSEMPEVLGVSDRILVMRDGEIIEELRGDEISEERVMLLATSNKT